ncbi:MAG: SMP-30/gluconolactonase/LRE family protein [Thermoanaerobaculia bacterium]
MKRLAWILLGILLAVASLLALRVRGAPISPAAWRPPPVRSLVRALAVSSELADVEVLAPGQVPGPEDVAVDAEGRVYAGTDDGRIVRVTLLPGGEKNVETFAQTGGRPLGLHFDARGNLLVCDAWKGLLSIDSTGHASTLATQAEGVPFGLADDVDIASDGTVYFSDASFKYDLGNTLHDLLEAKPHGRLLRHDPETGRTDVILDGLYFANGVALSSNEDYVLVVETFRYRITRHWLEGPRAGSSDVFIANLPGFPDGVSSNRRGLFWVALYAPRKPLVDSLHPYPWAKALLSTLPQALWPKAEPYGAVLALDETGVILRTLQDPTGEILSQTTSAEEHEGFLYLGTLHGDGVARYRLE